jgi:hypothetical protein
VKPFHPGRIPSLHLNGAHASIGSATVAEAEICLGYAAIILLALGSDGTAAAFARGWIHVSSGFTDALLVLVPVPDVAPKYSSAIAIYRHVLAASILLTGIHFLAFRKDWSRWGRRAGMIVTRMPRGREVSSELAQAGYFQTALGAAGTIMLMLYGDQMLRNLTDSLYAESWTFLRAPLLAVLAFALACNAAALRLASRTCLSET